jgi:hypothetical protein
MSTIHHVIILQSEAYLLGGPGKCPEQMLCPRAKLKNLCYIAGKVLQIRPKIKNSQKKSTAAGSSVNIQLYRYLGKFVPRGKLKNVCYIAGKVLQIRPKIQNSQKNSPAAGSSVYIIYSCLGKFVPRGKLKNLCYIAGKVLLIPPKINNSQKFLLRRAVQYIYSYIGKFVPEENWKNCAVYYIYIAETVLQIRPKIKRSFSKYIVKMGNPLGARRSQTPAQRPCAPRRFAPRSTPPPQRFPTGSMPEYNRNIRIPFCTVHWPPPPSSSTVPPPPPRADPERWCWRVL